MRKAADRFRRQALWIFGIALAVRILHLLQIRHAPFFTVLMGDSRSYDEWAQRIAAGDWIGREVFYQAPLYPYWLGTIYAFFGRNLLLVRIVQALIGSFSCVLLAAAGRRWFSNRVGVAAGLMLALYAPAIFFDGVLQKSTLDLFFTCLLLWLLSRNKTPQGEEPALQTGARRARAPWSWFWVGVTLGALTLTRENAFVLVAVVVTWALVERRPAADGRRHETDAGRLTRTVLLVAGVVLVLAPVAARNRYVGGGFYLTTSQLGPNLFIGNNAAADGTYAPLRYGRGAPEYERQDATEIAERFSGRRLTPAEVSRYWVGRAIDFVRSNPAAWLRLTLRKIVLLVNRGEMLDTESQESHSDWSWPLRVGATIGHFGVLVPLAALGMIVTWPDRRRLAMLHALLWTYAASVVVFYVFARYRFPLVPFLILFAAAAVSQVLQIAGEGRLSDLLRSRSALIVVAVAVLANWPMLSGRLMRTITEHNLGAALQTDGRLDEADSHYRRAIALSPDYAPAYNNLGTIARARGRLDEAIDLYERTLNLNRTYPEAHYNLGNALLDAGLIDEAIEQFQQAAQSNAPAADVHNNLGNALAARGRTDEAIREFGEAIAVDPSSPIAHRNLGNLLASKGDRDAALDHLRRAVAADRSNGDAYYDLGSLLLEIGAYDEAIVELQAAVERLPDSAEARNNLGIALGSSGRLDLAVEQFRDALRIRPDFADARRNLEMAAAAQRQIKPPR